MAQTFPTDKKRVKVYELRNNDWFDRGTGFCKATYYHIADEQRKEPRVIVESEDEPSRLLLETQICREDGFQKQQDTLIVWTEPNNGVDMALSFQEAEGCDLIWRFISSVQQTFQSNPPGPEDNLSDDLAMDMAPTISLPPAELGNLEDLEGNMRIMSSTANGRDALAKCIVAEDYIRKLIPLVADAEDLESLPHLHHLCNIMKIILLLNDTSIIEHAVSDECVIGVVGALEYDPDFPTHKANHRQWLNNQGRFKEVVRIQDDTIRKKIHQTYRLQYLKDVVLARILDDPTFSVLNSLIFFNQVDIVIHLQTNVGFLSDLFGIFLDSKSELLRKKEAVLFIQQCCAIAKNLQPPQRMTLYNNFLGHGLLQVINFGLRSTDIVVRVGATDILVSMIDHDPGMIRNTISRQIQEKQPPLTDTLIDLLLVEVDLGIKSQVSDALKVLLDVNGSQPPPDMAARAAANGENPHRVRPTLESHEPILGLLKYFYDHSAVRLFKPLLDLQGKVDLEFTVLNDSIFSYLNEILCFFIRHHGPYSRAFVETHRIPSRFAQLLGCREKHLQLVAIRFFRSLVSLLDANYSRMLIDAQVFGPVLEIVIRAVPRDNLLTSACLDLFELINLNKENTKDYLKHLADRHREKLQALAHFDTFRDLLVRGDQPQGYPMDPYCIDMDEDVVGRRPPNPNARMMEQLEVDPDQEAYWNTSDDEEEQIRPAGPVNGAPAPPKPLVDYPSDDEAEEAIDSEMATPTTEDGKGKEEQSAEEIAKSSAIAATPPPERVSEKRRREEDEEDDLGKLMQSKRRNSSSASMNASAAHLRRRKSFTGRESPANGPKKISISLPLKTAGSEEEGG